LNIHVPIVDKINDMMISFGEKLEHVFDKFLEHHMKMLLGDFNAKLGTEGILKPMIGPESFHEICNDIVVRVVNFVTSRNLIVKSTMFLHHNSHNFFFFASPEDSQIDHILIDRRQHSSVLDVRSFRAADCDDDHYMVVATFGERQAVNNRQLTEFTWRG
jgi:hypothetical protein